MTTPVRQNIFHTAWYRSDTRGIIFISTAIKNVVIDFLKVGLVQLALNTV